MIKCTLLLTYTALRINRRELIFLYESLKWISKYKNNNGNLIVGGDVNCVDWPLDRSSFVTDKSSDALRKLKSSLDIIDVWKFMNSRRYQLHVHRSKL